VCSQQGLLLSHYLDGSSELDLDLTRHIETCQPCQRYLVDLDQIATLTEAPLLPDAKLGQIEIEVYKRLATNTVTASIPANDRLFSFSFLDLIIRFKDSVSLLLNGFRFRKLVWLIAFILAIIAGWRFLNPNPTSVLASTTLRLETYRQEQIHQHLEEANAMQHLKNDSWASAGMFRLVQEQAQGTELESYAGQQIQVVQNQRR